MTISSWSGRKLGAAFAAVALLVSGAAQAATVVRHTVGAHRVTWSGLVHYSRSSVHTLGFVVTGTRVTYFLIGYDCQHQSDGYTTEGSANDSVNVPISHGAFTIDYTNAKNGDVVHLIFKGTLTGAGASGTLNVLEDKNLGGACNSGPAKWKAHAVS